MVNWLTTREAVKAALSVGGSDRDVVIDPHIVAASKKIEESFGRQFIPRTKTRVYRWPQAPRLPWNLRGTTLDLEVPVLSVSALTSKNGTVTIASDDYFLEPANGTRKYRIEIDLGDDVASDAAFGVDDSGQRAISVTAIEGWSDDTETAGTVRDSGGINDSVTSLLVSDASLIGVGQTLLIGTEQLFVSGRTAAAEENNDLLAGALTKSSTAVAVTVDNGTRYNVGEVILVDAEKMLITSISGNVLTVERRFDGSTLASHLNDAPVSVYRTLTVVRGVNGTTAATHAQTAAIVKYAPPELIQQLCRAEAIFYYKEETGGYAGQVGSGEVSQGTSGLSFVSSGRAGLWKRCEQLYKEVVFA